MGVQKLWNLSLLSLLGGWVSQKSVIVHYFSLQISDVHTFFCINVTSQLLKQRKKSCFFFKPKVCLFLDNCETKKCFYCLAQQHCCLDKKKKKHLTLFFCFLFPSFWNLEEKNNSEKDKTKKRFFFFKGKCSLFCFWPWANFASNKMSRVLAFKSKLCR